MKARIPKTWLILLGMVAAACSAAPDTDTAKLPGDIRAKHPSNARGSTL